MSTHLLAGSECQAMPGARASNPAHPDERLEVSLHLRRRDARGFSSHLESIMAGHPRHRLDRLDRDGFAARFGAAPEDIAAVTAFAEQAGLSVVQSDAARRVLVLSGTVARLNAAFNVELRMYEHESGAYRGRTGAIYLPENLADIVQAVLGLDNRPQAAPHFRLRPPDAGAARPAGFTPTELASLYRFPDGSGDGQCIALIELGGGYRSTDLSTYFAGLGLKPPQVSSVSVDHGKNQPSGNPGGADGEVMLDIEVAGAIAPAARIVVYFAPNTDAGFLDAVTTAIHDTQNKPSVLSISWGGPESSWTQQAMRSFDDAFQSAAALGVTVCVAAGDGGSSDGAGDNADHVDFPASSPHALACGGTSLTAGNGTISNETVWNDGAEGGATGGGVSSFFALPDWQKQLSVVTGGDPSPLTMRGVPDVAGDADPRTGYAVRVDGTNTVIGGTSAVAPLWAGLIARINNTTKDGSVGFVHPRLYGNTGAFNDVTQGSNGAFSATAGWDACTGLGTPVGEKLSEVL